MAAPIVGRDIELAAVERFLDAADSWPAALVVEGEAGIGKTTIWFEGIRGAERRGLRVLQARPAESEARLSYSTLADLVGTAFDEHRTTLPVPQERALAVALLRDEPTNAAEPRTTATGLVGVLGALAADGPTLVAIDDVQWLDPASEQALAFAVRRLPPKLGLLLARRTAGEARLPFDLGRALSPERVDRIVPAPLSLAALHHLISDSLGSSLPRPMLIRIASASGGNPLFALEIARALGRGGDGRSAGDPLPVPRSMEELVAARVAGLSEIGRRAAFAAAALSRPTAAVVVEALAEEGDARAALAEAEDAGILVADRERIRFAHPVLASALYASASYEQRRRVHERLGAVVADPEERARHLALAANEADESTAVEIERAAAQAARRGAQQAAAELFAASSRLTPDDRPEELTRRWVGEASALLAAGDDEGARVLAERAAASPSSQQAHALFLLGEIAWIGGGVPSDAFERALAAAPGDDELAARIYPKLVGHTGPHDPARAIAHAEAAIEVLSPDRQPGALAFVLWDRVWAGMMVGEGMRWDLFERWRELEARAGPEAPKSPTPLIYFWSVDDFEGARARHAVEDAWYRERGEDLWRAERLGHLGYAELRAGRWDVARRYVEEACDTLAPQLARPGPWASAFRFRSFVDAHMGRTDRARSTLVPFIARAEEAGRKFWAAIALSALAFVEFADGDYAAVDGALTRMRELLEEIGTKEFAPDLSEPFHVESLIALGELERARRVLERLEERGRIFPRLWIDVTLPRARALVLAAEDDLDGALAALDELDVEAASKLPFDLAWNRLVQGRLHRRLKQKTSAAAAFREALAIFERLGATAWVEQARGELERVGLRRAPTELTPTELRVAELAASGMTNREVATAAFMSPKTVQANLARIYRKLGISSRAELGARMSKTPATEPQT